MIKEAEGKKEEAEQALQLLHDGAEKLDEQMMKEFEKKVAEGKRAHKADDGLMKGYLLKYTVSKRMLMVEASFVPWQWAPRLITCLYPCLVPVYVASGGQAVYRGHGG